MRCIAAPKPTVFLYASNEELTVFIMTRMVIFRGDAAEDAACISSAPQLPFMENLCGIGSTIWSHYLVVL
jgi:hypothetical protein